MVGKVSAGHELDAVSVSAYGASGELISSAIASRDGLYFVGIVNNPGIGGMVNAIARDYWGAEIEASSEIAASGSEQEGLRLSSDYSGVWGIGVNGSGSQGKTVLLTATVGAGPASEVLLYEWDINGDGRIDISCGNASSITAKYSYPGIYLPSVRMTAVDGSVYSDSIVLQFLDNEASQEILVNVWDLMKARLAERDIAGALRYHAEPRQRYFEAVYKALYTDLPTIVADMREPELVYLRQDSAKLRLKRIEQLADGRQFDVSYFIYFVLDRGAWRIYRY